MKNDKLQPLANSEKDLEDLFAKRPQIIKPGLERIRAAWEFLRMDRYKLKVILVAGTNGKGSTAGTLWHLLAGLNIRIGLFTSPHLCCFSERFQCSQAPIKLEYILKSLHSLSQELPKDLYDDLSFFDTSTLLAIKLFEELACSIAIFEVGLGGRWDSTNILSPLLSVISSIDKDHESWLGHEFWQIASEKLGICREKTPLFWGEPATAAKKLQETLASKQTKLALPVFAINKNFGRLNSEEGFIDLCGNDHQRYAFPRWVANSSEILQQNFCLAFAIFAWLLKNYPSINPAKKSHYNYTETVQKALEQFGAPHIPWPNSLLGRFQFLKLTQKVKTEAELNLKKSSLPSLYTGILDVCHNPAACNQFVKTLEKIIPNLKQNNHCLGFVSILADKNYDLMLDILKDFLNPLLLVRGASRRSFHADLLAARHKDLLMFDRFSHAWDYAKEHYLDRGQTFTVCGSFLIVGEVINHFSAFPQNEQLEQNLHGTLP